MRTRPISTSNAVTFAITFSILTLDATTDAQAQVLPPPPVSGEVEADVSSTVEVLTRGPIHEAFAAQIDVNATPSIVVKSKPPAPIDELPPKTRPKGNAVVWIPGYWAWDDHSEDFLWVSGVWRKTPPGHRWVPGYWDDADDGYRWVSGVWVKADVQSLRYLPPAPKSQERGPSSEAPSKDHQWVPGCWVRDASQYRWRPGYWARGHADWIWIPDHYVWTPAGSVYVAGYWDHRLSHRGILFAPIRVRTDLGVANIRLTPNVVIDPDRIFLHLFVRPTYHHYYFGDYYGDTYVSAGIYPWFQFRSGVRGYDPLLNYYVWHNARTAVDIVARLDGWHSYYKKNTELRPPHTFAGLSAFVDTHGSHVHAQQSLLGQPLAEVIAGTSLAFPVVQLTDAQVGAVAATVGGVQQLALSRLNVEGAVAVVAGSTTAATVGVTDTILDLPAVTNPLGLPGIDVPSTGVPGIRVPRVLTPDLPVPGAGRLPGVRLPGIRVPL